MKFLRDLWFKIRSHFIRKAKLKKMLKNDPYIYK